MPVRLLARCLGVLALLSFLCSFALANQARAEGRRVALVIGNAAYQHVSPLANPSHDARLIASTLRSLGFELVGGGPQIDLDKARLDQVLQRFGSAIVGADVALLYYSGHGLQVQGANWLAPVDANPTRAQDLDFQMVSVDVVLHQMEGAGTRLNVLILDACRNNPFITRGIRAATGGLAQMQAPEGTLISYATQPGNVALDGAGANSPFAAALARALPQPGYDIFQTFNAVGVAVKRETAGAQQPWVSNSPIEGQFYFATNRAGQPPGPAVANEPPARPVLPATPAPEAATRPFAPGAAPGRSQPFDGRWEVVIDCAGTPDGAKPYRWRFDSDVRDGSLLGQFHQPGTNASGTLSGLIQLNGDALLRMNGNTGSPQYTIGHVDAGTPFHYTANAHFGSSTGAGKRNEMRQCDLTFTRS